MQDNQLDSRWARFRQFVRKYERHVGAGSVVLGFIVDSIFLVRPDELWGNLLLVSYLLLSALGILILAIYRRKNKEAPILLLPFVQFLFGNLAGGLVVLYGRSGTLEGSFLFFVLLIGFVIGNEFMRSYYARVNFHISAWFLLLLAYLVLIIPIILGRFGDLIFIISAVISLIIVSFFLYLLHYVSRESVREAFRTIFFSIITIFIIFNCLYFLNILPPVPLGLREIGIYHSISKKENGMYVVLSEKPRWHEFFQSQSRTFSYIDGETVYCFSSVYAPVSIDTGIKHRFEFYDETVKKWQNRGLVSFNIEGGRQEGYRGFSQKSALEEGKWRCSIETGRGALIGRTVFKIKKTEGPIKLEQSTI